MILLDSHWGVGGGAGRSALAPKEARQFAYMFNMSVSGGQDISAEGSSTSILLQVWRHVGVLDHGRGPLADAKLALRSAEGSAEVPKEAYLVDSNIHCYCERRLQAAYILEY